MAEGNRLDGSVNDYRTKKALLEETNNLVTRPIARIDGSVLPSKLKNGRPKKYSPTQMKNGINKYFEACELNDELPSIKGLMIHLKMYKDQFYQYMKYPDYTNIMEHARLIIANWIEEDIYKTKGMAAGKIAYAKNLHGWADKIDTNNVTEQRVVTVDEARAKIEMLAPRLLELLKSNTVLNQLTHSPSVVEAEIEPVR